MGPQTPVCDQVRQPVKPPGCGFVGKLLKEREAVEARTARAEELARVECSRLSPRNAEGHARPARRDHLQRVPQGAAAHRLQDEVVGAVGGGSSSIVVDHRVGAYLSNRCSVALLAEEAGHVGAHRHGELYGEVSHPALCAGDQHPLTEQSPTLLQPVEGGEARDG